MDEELKKEIRKMALQNAFEHGGETRDKIILGKILGTKPEFRSKGFSGFAPPRHGVALANSFSATLIMAKVRPLMVR